MENNGRSLSEWRIAGSDWFKELYRYRQSKEYNNLILITGPLGGGKTSTGIRLGEQLDPNFSIDKIVFTPKEFTQEYNRADKGSTLVWDEANLGLGHRNFMTEMNKAIVGFIQSSRFLEVSVVFTLPQYSLMDSAAVKVSNFLMRMLRRGYVRVHTIEPNYLSKSPPFRTPTLGHLTVNKPSSRIWEAYSAKRSMFHKKFFGTERFEEGEKELIEEGETKPWDQIAANHDQFKTPYGEISAAKIETKFGVSTATAYNWKHRAEGIIESKKHPSP